MPAPQFVKIFNHDTSGGLFYSTQDALSKNPDNPDAKLFSVLNKLQDYRNHEGNFHFKLCYPEVAGASGGHCNEWFQSSNPTPCLASPQPQVSCPRAGPPPPSLIHMEELGFVGLLNNPKRTFAQLQKLEVKLANT